MPRYQYTARTPNGEPRSGVVEAPDRATAVARVEQTGAIPVSVREDAKTGKPAAAGRMRATPKKAAARMRRTDLLQFTRELSDLLSSGMTLGSALHTLSGRPAGRGRQIVEALRDAIVRGESLSDALAEWPQTFPPLFISMIRAGEASGALGPSLMRLAEHYERVQDAREKISAALVYPALVLGIGMATVIFIMVYVVPRFASMFAELGSVLPLPTRILIGVADSFRGGQGLLIGGVLAAAVFAAWRGVRTPRGSRIRDRLALRLPGVRNIVAASAFSHFAETLASLLENGVPVLDALRIVADTVGNSLIADEIHAARERVTDGSTISGPLAAGTVFPAILTDMLAVGERTGDMASALMHIARRFQTERDRSVKIFITILEPLLIVGVAAVVGFVAISMLLAVFDLTSGLTL